MRAYKTRTHKHILDKLKREKYFTEQKTIGMVRVILDAVKFCHREWIVHRDLRLENILFKSQRQEPKDLVIIDFGDAEKVEQHSKHNNFS